MQGNLRACDRIEIKKNACVEGDMAAAHLVIEKGAHFKGRAEADGLRTRELVGNARNRGPDFRYDEDSNPAFTQKRGDVLKNLGSDLGTASPMQARPPLPRRNKPTKFSTARLQLAAVQNLTEPGPRSRVSARAGAAKPEPRRSGFRFCFPGDNSFSPTHCA